MPPKEVKSEKVDIVAVETHNSFAGEVILCSFLGYNWLQILTLIPSLGSVWCGLMKMHVGAVHARPPAAAKKAVPGCSSSYKPQIGVFHIFVWCS